MSSLVVSVLAFQVLGGVSIRDAVVTTCVIGVQCISGLIALRIISKYAELEFITSLAAGLALGTALSTIADQLFLKSPISDFSWLLPLIIGLLVHRLYKNGRTIFSTLSADFSFIPFLLLPIPLLYGDLRESGALVIFLLGTAILLRRMTRRLNQAATLGLLTLVPVGIVIIGLSTRSSNQYGTRMLKPLFTGSDDLVFSESLSFSLSHFGIFDYAASIGTSIRYHWFSMAWTGLVDRVAHPEPFVVTLHSAPVFVAVAIAGIGFGISRLLVRSDSLGYLLVIALFGTSSSIEPHRFFTLFNTSNFVSFMWVLLFIFLLLFHLKGSLPLSFIVLPIVAVVVLVSKAPYGVPLLFGLFGLVTQQAIVKSSRRREHFILLGTTVLSMVCAYIMFLTPHEWEKRVLSTRLNVFSFPNFGLLEKMTTLTIVVFLIAALIVPGLYFLGTVRDKSSADFLAFLIGGSLVGPLRFLLSGASGELYFLGVSIVFSSTISCWALAVALKNYSPSRQLQITLLLVPSISSLLPILASYDIVNLSMLTNSGRFLIVPTAVACVIATAFWMMLKTRTISTLAVFILLSFLSMSISRFFVVSIKPVEYLSTTEVASNEDVRSLTWLRGNTQSNAIIATNRFLCASTDPCSFDDSSFLISAVARRRVLVEGPRFVIGGRPYPQWMTDRIALSTRFAERPNEDDLRTLKDYGVDWFVVNERFLPTGTLVESDWAKFGIIRYRQDGVAIIELRS
jgi:hypothetical protein